MSFYSEAKVEHPKQPLEDTVSAFGVQRGISHHTTGPYSFAAAQSIFIAFLAWEWAVWPVLFRY
jgi:hypothetical protein